MNETLILLREPNRIALDKVIYFSQQVLVNANGYFIIDAAAEDPIVVWKSIMSSIIARWLKNFLTKDSKKN